MSYVYIIRGLYMYNVYMNIISLIMQTVLCGVAAPYYQHQQHFDNKVSQLPATQCAPL